MAEQASCPTNSCPNLPGPAPTLRNSGERLADEALEPRGHLQTLLEAGAKRRGGVRGGPLVAVDTLRV